MYCCEELLSYLKLFQESSSELKKCHTFNKLSSVNEFGELVSVCSTNNKQNEELLNKELQLLIKDISGKSALLPVVSFTLKENRIFLKLDWLSTVKSIFTDIFECKNIYGSSKKFSNKAVRIFCGESKNELTTLRVATAGNVVSELVALGGGSVTDSEDVHTAVVISPRPGSDIVVGSVHVAGSADTSEACYIRLRRMELQENEHRELSEELIDQLVSATVVFDLLSVKTSRPLVLNSSILPNSATKSNCKGSTFVLYNYARVCSILDKFNDFVSKGIYKPLSSFHDLDYNLLLKKEDWRLVFDYLAEWPFVVAQCQEFSKPKLHNIVGFVSSLATTFSVYYKYNRVLNDGLEHMSPLMEARIYLLKAIKQVFLAAFSLLRIDAPTKM